MQKIVDLIGHPLKWTQVGPHMKYELRSSDNLVATLNFRNDWGTMAAAENADGAWTFKRVGFWQNRASIRLVGSEQDLAIFANNTWSSGGTLEFTSGASYKASTNFWSTRMEWKTGELDEPLIAFHIGGFFKQSAEVEIDPAAASLPELPLLILFGWYLIIMLHRDSAAVAAIAAST